MNALELPALYAAGLLTFASPCVLPLVPLYLASVTGASLSQGRAFGAAAGFSAGMSLVFVAMGLAASAVGRLLSAHREALLYVAGAVVILFGLKFLGVIRLRFMEGEARPWLERISARGVFGGVLLGAGFALGWSPCIGPVLGGVLTYAASTSSSPGRGALLLAAYAAGLSTPLLIVGALAARAQPWMKSLRTRMGAMQKATGVLLVAMGLLLVTDSLSSLIPTEADAPAVAGVCDGSSPCAISPPLASDADAVVSIPAGPVMIEFVSGNCPVCQRMMSVVDAAEHACEGQGTKTVRMRVDTAEGRKAAALYGVRGVPTFLFVDASGAESARLIGEQPLTALRTAIENVSGANCPRG